MVASKGWEWEKADQDPWLSPSDDAYFLAEKWRNKGYKRILDLGCGLGRHAVFFAQQGFEVSAIDISDYAIAHLESWSNAQSLNIHTAIGDMVDLPYTDSTFDSVFACHVISHTDSVGIHKILSEIERVTRTDGEFYTSFCAKESSSFHNALNPKLDENTVINKEEGPEFDVPHFYVDRPAIFNLMNGFNIERIRLIEYSFTNEPNDLDRYYYVNAVRK